LRPEWSFDGADRLDKFDLLLESDHT